MRPTQLAWRGLEGMKALCPMLTVLTQNKQFLKVSRLKAPSTGDTTSIELQGSVETVVAINAKSPVLFCAERFVEKPVHRVVSSWLRAS